MKSLQPIPVGTLSKYSQTVSKRIQIHSSTENHLQRVSKQTSSSVITRLACFLSARRSGLRRVPNNSPPKSSGLTVNGLHGRHILKLLKCQVIGSCAKGSLVSGIRSTHGIRSAIVLGIRSTIVLGPVAMSSGSRVSARMKLDQINGQEFIFGHSLLSLWPLTQFCVSQGQRNYTCYWSSRAQQSQNTHHNSIRVQQQPKRSLKRQLFRSQI